MFEETSIKVTESGLRTDRICFGFDAAELDYSAIKTFVGEDNYNQFAQIFPRPFYDPKSYSSIMFGRDGSDFEMYVEYGPDIMSYDIGKKEECIYHSLGSDHFRFIYEYIQSKVNPVVYGSLTYAMQPDKCELIYLKKTKRHLFSYLLKYRTFVRVPAVKKQLISAMRSIYDTDIEMNDDLSISYIGIAVTWDGRCEMSVYFRKPDA